MFRNLILSVQTRDMVETVGKFLGIKGIPVTMFHAGMSYTDRKRALENFRNGNSTVGVTTNVLERGIDIPNVRAVLNFELPVCCESNIADTKRYWYRIGRASRFG